MTEIQKPKREYDLEERTFQFAKAGHWILQFEIYLKFGAWYLEFRQLVLLYWCFAIKY